MKLIGTVGVWTPLSAGGDRKLFAIFHSLHLCASKGTWTQWLRVFCSAFIFRGICFQDIEASSTISNHLFERRASLPFALPPALNKAACTKKQTSPSPWGGEACWAIGEMCPRKTERKKLNEKGAFLPLLLPPLPSAAYNHNLG